MQYYFNCNKCGQCCNSGPALSFKEIFKYQHDFIIGLRFSAQQKPSDNMVLTNDKSLTKLEAQEWEDHLKGITPTLTADGKQYHLQIYPFVAGYSIVDGNSCEQLAHDNSCKIHEHRPLMCRAVPFDIIMPESLQEFCLESFKNYGCVSDSNESINSLELIYKEKTISTNEYSFSFKAKLEAWKGDLNTTALIATLMHKKSPYMPDIDTILDVAENGGWFETDVSPVLMTSLSQGLQKENDTVDFINAQTALIEQEVYKALQRKDKRERERTNTLRGYLRTYKALSEKIKQQPA